MTPTGLLTSRPHVRPVGAGTGPGPMTLPPNTTQRDLVRLSLLLCPSSPEPSSASSATRAG
jgi:hypothetical protein